MRLSLKMLSGLLTALVLTNCGSKIGASDEEGFACPGSCVAETSTLSYYKGGGYPGPYGPLYQQLDAELFDDGTVELKVDVNGCAISTTVKRAAEFQALEYAILNVKKELHKGPTFIDAGNEIINMAHGLLAMDTLYLSRGDSTGNKYVADAASREKIMKRIDALFANVATNAECEEKINPY